MTAESGEEVKPIVSREGGDPTRRRLLLLSYHFPPGDATGALRWQRMAALGHDRGWEMDVVAAHPDVLPRVDWTRIEELPPGTRVWGVRPRTLLMDRVERALLRGWKAIRGDRADEPRGSGAEGAPAEQGGASSGDDGPSLIYRHELTPWFSGPKHVHRAVEAAAVFAREGAWAWEAAEAAERIIDSRHRLVVSCGPPHMAHPAARRVARRARLPFVMDLRDPWSLTPALPPTLASPVYYRMAERHEERSVASASLVVANTETLRIALRALYPRARERVVCVMNGVDEEALPEPVRSERFSIAYAGNIYIDRDPRPLFRAAAAVVRELDLTPDHFGIELLGHVEQFASTSVAQLARDAGIEPYVRILPRRPRREALEFLAGATMLLSLPQDVDLSIPSKIFEYMQFEAWLLVLARRGSATELALRGTGADVVDPSDEHAIASAIRRRIRQYAGGEVPRRLVDDNPHLTRRVQAQRLFDALEAVDRGLEPS